MYLISPVRLARIKEYIETSSPASTEEVTDTWLRRITTSHQKEGDPGPTGGTGSPG